MTELPQKLGKYQIHEKLGHGGFATVYRAIDTTLDREVALKILDPLLTRDPTFIDRFRQEARMTARLFHPNIATVFDIGEGDQRHFIAMQYIPGHNLRDLMHERAPLPFGQIMSIIQQIGAALDYAHAQGAIHRDVKPSNIIVHSNEHTVLTDFGIAKVLGKTNVHTTAGAVMGTPYYASPEQAESKPLDGRSDLYSLGIVAYELCTATLPFDADTTPALYYKIVHEEPRLPSQAHRRAGGSIEQVLLKALAKRPEQRYQSGHEFAAALAQAVKQVEEATQLLFDRAVNRVSKGELDIAADDLHHVLAVYPDHEDAQRLLVEVGERRNTEQRYQEIVDLVTQARAGAAELRRLNPDVTDPSGVLGLLKEDGDIGSTDQSAASESANRVSVLPKGFAVWLLIIGAIVAIIGWLEGNVVVMVGGLDPSELVKVSRLQLGNLLLGLGIGIGLVSLVLMVMPLIREST